MNQPKYNPETQRHEIDGVPFDGHFLEWKFEYVPRTYLKESELSGDEWRKGGAVKIYLNGDCVLNEFCRSEDRAVFLVAKHLHELKCCFEILPVGLQDIKTWKEDIVGRRIYHTGVPSIVERYCGDGEILVRTEDGKPYEIYGHKQEEKKEDPEGYEDEWQDKDRVHITDIRLSWYRK